MPRKLRSAVRMLVVTIALVSLSLTGLTTGAQAAGAPRPGLVGKPLLLQDNTQLNGYDVAVDAAGYTYIGWIGNDSSTTTASRRVRLCTLPPGAVACAGGVQVIDSLGPSSADGLRVLAAPGGTVSLVWFHDSDPGSVTGPRGGRIAVATTSAGGTLSPATDVADAPSFGQLLDAQLGPDGSLWTIAYEGVGTISEIELRAGVGNAPTPLPIPYSVGTTQLAFSGSTPVVAVTKYGSVSDPISTAQGPGGVWSRFAPVRNTWSAGQVGLAAASSGLRLVASVGNANYYPAVARFTGSGFTRAKLTGDKNACHPTSHDLVADRSGRLADVGVECDDIAVANMADSEHSAVVRFKAGNTVAGGDPQIAATPRGNAWVAWSVQSTTGNKLLAGRVLLPPLPRSVKEKFRQGNVIVTGPATCLPGAGVAVSVRGRRGAGWLVASETLWLDGKRFRKDVLDGSKLTPGSAHKLSGRVEFTRDGDSVTRAATISFRSCGAP